MKKQKGFTLIELLVVIAIIGLLSTLAVVSLNTARAKARDAQRIAAIKAIQTGLEMYFNDAGAYPAVPLDNVCVGNGLHSLGKINGCNISSAGITKVADSVDPVYVDDIADDPSAAAATGNTFVYTRPTTTTYTVTYITEGKVGGVDCTGAGCTATQSGIN